uniref:Gustatory receptor n=1 Tax=Globodera rostochiensis TaxID=31243 RepID=A0A914IEG5_GLORO
MLYGNVLSYAELVVHPISLMTSFFTVALIINTSVLHSNLKCILLGQSAGIVMFEIARTVYVVIKFVAGNVFFQGPIAIQMLGLFGYTLRNVVSHVLIAERTIATIKFRTYGQFNWVGFTTLWLTASIGISSWITFSQEGSPWSVSPIAMISICVVFGTGLIEITTLIFLQVYNLRKYRSSRTGVNLSLNDKYQISENIRTARQLAPTFVLHFLNACVNNGMSFLIFFDVIQHTYSISLGFIISSLFNGFSGALVDLIVIMHHPLLKKKAKHWLLQRCCIEATI